MRRNSKLIFTKRANRPPLKSEEVRYWKNILRKIFKVGFEYEYNLRENNGTCKGDTYACPCNHPEKEIRKCYAECKVFNSCKLRKKYECPGIYCVEFVSPCPSCAEAVRDCDRCDLYDNPAKKAANARKNISNSLQPTHSLAVPGKFGALKVIKDGSLLGDGGVEVVTVGRRVDYESFLAQSKKIIEECRNNGAFLSERASIHIHLVAGYFDLSFRNGQLETLYGKKSFMAGNEIQELEKPVPEIILANFHQLLRRYHNAITWISSAGTSKDALTRWVKFRKSLLKYSALRTTMKNVKKEMANDIESEGKYAFVNYYNTYFESSLNKTNRVKRLHVEGRFCDGMLSPSAISSIGILLYALMIKAVSLSQYGVLNSGQNGYMKNALEIQETLLNNDGSYQGPRHSDTSRFEPYMETVRTQAAEMVNLLHSELRLHGQALDVLRKLAEMPCSMRLVNGDDWDKIEEDLSGGTKTENASIEKIMEVIDTFYVDDCVDSNEWISAISHEIAIETTVIKEVTEALTRSRTIAWDGIVGTYVRC